MGVVWEAYDQRLERRVAIKRVRPDAIGDGSMRRRFRREARMAARLTHPSIVQIFDLVEQDEADWLVMELVTGPSIASRIAHEGTLGVDESIRIARDVAEGLAEAHRLGLVHRDLKAENVLVTPVGRAKILDFGLAKPFVDSQPDDNLSRLDQVVGTSRAMAPEQIARPASVDPRADLFALGVLIYEMTTGASPFAAGSRAETIERIYTLAPTPIHERNPAVPEALATLVDRLLEKDRRRRPENASQVVDDLVALTTATDAATPKPPAEDVLDASTFMGSAESVPDAESTSSDGDDRRRWIAWAAAAAILVAVITSATVLLHRVPPLVVAVVPVAAGQHALLAAALETTLERNLARFEGIVALPAAHDADPPIDPAAWLTRTAADEAIAAELQCDAALRRCQVALRRLRSPDGHLLWADTFDIPDDDVSVATNALASGLARAFPRRARPDPAWADIDQETLTAYLAIRSAFERRSTEAESGDTEVDPNRDVSDVQARVESLIARAPSFLEPRLLLAEVAKTDFFHTRDERALVSALDGLEAARRLAPDDPRPLVELIAVALAAGRVDAAATSLEALESRWPGDSRIDPWRALIAEQRGQSEAALETMLRAADRRPSRRTLIQLANLAIRLGEIEIARDSLTRLESRLGHDTEALALRAQIELFFGDPGRAVPLYERLVAGAPTVDERTNLGVAQMLSGRYREAARTFRAAHREAPANAGILLNLADAEALAGNEIGAEALYRRTLDLIEKDAAVNTFWNALTIRGQAQAHLGQTEDAVASVLEARRLAPDNPQVLYESAVVFALVGDRASALVTARAAQEAGVDRRWFAFPWFDALRPELE